MRDPIIRDLETGAKAISEQAVATMKEHYSDHEYAVVLDTDHERDGVSDRRGFRCL